MSKMIHFFDKKLITCCMSDKSKVVLSKCNV